MNPLVTLGLPALVAVSGVTAAVVSSVTGDDASAGVAATAVWIDAPLDNVVLAPGIIVVKAHAIGEGLSSLELLVDGASAGVDSDLQFTGGLGFAEIPWQAAEGVHELQVRDQAGSVSLVNVVSIQGAGTPPPTTVPSSTTTAPATTSTTAVSTSTTTTVVPTTVVPTTVAPTAPPTAPPTTAPPAPTVGTPSLQQGACQLPYQGTVQASVSNATSAQVRIVGTGLDATVPMSIASGTASATVPLSIEGGSHTVTVTVSGAGGSASGSASRTIDSCKP